MIFIKYYMSFLFDLETKQAERKTHDDILIHVYIYIYIGCVGLEMNEN